MRDKILPVEQPQEQAASDRSPAGEAATEVPFAQRCGPHTFYLRDDVLVWAGQGAMSQHDIATLFAQRSALQRQHGRAFLLVDARQLSGVSAEGRRFAAQFKPEPPLRGMTVVFGAGLLTRAAVSLVVGAARFFGWRGTQAAVFADDEAQGWAMIERERLVLSSARADGQ